MHAPPITAADCEGAGEMFQVTAMMHDAEKTGGKVPIAVDGNIDYSTDCFWKTCFPHNERPACSGELLLCNFQCEHARSNVSCGQFTHTPRQLAGFWMIDPELSFADINGDIRAAGDYLKHCVKIVYDSNFEDFEYFDKQVEPGLLKRIEIA